MCLFTQFYKTKKKTSRYLPRALSNAAKREGIHSKQITGWVGSLHYTMPHIYLLIKRYQLVIIYSNLQ